VAPHPSPGHECYSKRGWPGVCHKQSVSTNDAQARFLPRDALFFCAKPWAPTTSLLRLFIYYRRCASRAKSRM